MKNNIAGAKEIMELGILLDKFPGVDVYVAFQGNTGCLCVQVDVDGEQAYGNRTFASNFSGIMEIRQDMSRMILSALKLMKEAVGDEG